MWKVLFCVFHLNSRRKLHFVPFFFSSALYEKDFEYIKCRNLLLSAAGELVDILLYINLPGVISMSDLADSIPFKSAYCWHYDSQTDSGCAVFEVTLLKVVSLSSFHLCRFHLTVYG